MYPTFPDGTIHAADLPENVYRELTRHVDLEGFVDSSIGPVCGNYLMFAGYKVKVTIEEVLPDVIYKVRLL